MSSDPGATHYVGDGCQPAHDPRIDQAHTSTVLCKQCRTYHLDHAPELRDHAPELRGEVERLTLADRQWADHVKRLSEENERLQRENGSLARMSALTAEKLRERTGRLNQAEAEVKRLRGVLDEIAAEDDE
jgi:tRNA C32,U32 (ribose-2'-O)-methylase TrmJ